MKRDRVLSVKLPEGVINDLDNLVNIEGKYLSKSDALRYGARLVIFFANVTSAVDKMKKEARDRM
jgi:Arc/MetJ-type ribon-helix-helix transcriptional regulator